MEVRHKCESTSPTLDGHSKNPLPFVKYRYFFRLVAVVNSNLQNSQIYINL